MWHSKASPRSSCGRGRSRRQGHTRLPAGQDSAHGAHGWHDSNLSEIGGSSAATSRFPPGRHSITRWRPEIGAWRRHASITSPPTPSLCESIALRDSPRTRRSIRQCPQSRRRPRLEKWILPRRQLLRSCHDHDKKSSPVYDKRPTGTRTPWRCCSLYTQDKAFSPPVWTSP